MRIEEYRNKGFWLFLFVPMVLFKSAIDLKYVLLLRWEPVMFPLDFNWIKFVIGFFCCMVLFLGIDHAEKKASTFFLYAFFLLQIVPITTIYAFANESNSYYFSIVASTLLCELIVRFVKGKDKNAAEAGKLRQVISVGLILGFSLLVVVTIFWLFRVYGWPETTAINVLNAYEIREKAANRCSLLSYLIVWTSAAILPFLLARAVTARRTVLAVLIASAALLIYLYTGNKTTLFMLPMVIGCSLWAKRKNCYKELFFCLCIGMTVLVFLACIEEDHINGFFNILCSMFGRRAIIVPANNKFMYFKYFSTHPKMGVYGGIVPQWLFKIKSYYEGVPYTYEIARIYFDKPEMNANTGFLAEGFMRFGHVGTFLIMFLFAMILKGIDRFQDRAGYAFAIGAFIYPIYGLNDAHLFDSIFFGPWMLLIALMLFYQPDSLRALSGRLSNS